jgi:hypothetical protein
MHEQVKYVCPKCLTEYSTSEEEIWCYMADKGWVDRETGESLLGETSPVANYAKTGWLRTLMGVGTKKNDECWRAS